MQRLLKIILGLLSIGYIVHTSANDTHSIRFYFANLSSQQTTISMWPNKNIIFTVPPQTILSKTVVFSSQRRCEEIFSLELRKMIVWEHGVWSCTTQPTYSSVREALLNTHELILVKTEQGCCINCL